MIDGDCGQHNAPRGPQEPCNRNPAADGCQVRAV